MDSNDSSTTVEMESYLDFEERELATARNDSERDSQVRPFMSLLSLIAKHHAPLCWGILMVVLGTFAALMEPRIFGYAIDEALVPRSWEKLQVITAVFFGVTLIRVFSAMRQAYYFELLGQRVTQELRMKVFSHLQNMEISVYDKNPAGRFLTRVTNDIASLNEMFSAGFLTMLCNFFLVSGILIWLFVLDFKLGLISSSVFPLLVAVSIYFSKRLKIAYRDARTKLSAVNSFLAENLLGIKIIQLFNRQQARLKRFERLNQWYADAQVSSIRTFAYFQPTITIAAGISISLIIWFGGLEAYNGRLKLGVLVAFFSYSLSLFQPVREIADKWNVFLSGMASADRIFAVLNWKTERHSSDDLEIKVVPLDDLRGHIVFENVWFAYEAENWVLKDFSIEISPGKKVGVVGHTGAGKTTLISLLMRFYEPQRGRILIDGNDIRSYDRRALRAAIGVVQQDVFLFSGSFEENITFWRSIESQRVDAILNSLKLQRSQMHSLQERGTNLSMGERQMIAFGRVMASEPKIWILDEATSSMDSDTERMIQSALELASESRTGILIAHRLATVKSADLILVLHKGSLAESGTHSELMEKDRLYARLYRYQAAHHP